MKAFLKSVQTPGLSFPLGEFINLGRDSECQICLADDSISERHARIEKRGDKFFLKDLRSLQGSYVNDLMVNETELKDGDLIRLGQQELFFCLESASEKSFDLNSRNSSWNETLQRLVKVAQTDFPILLLGPSGTGKDVIAQKLHECSHRNAGPLVSVNCSALTETLVESELFGHVKGSFTGAINDRKGAFEAARGGTLFLDEIGDLTYGLQAKLLRALENNEIRPVGSDRVVKTDVRIVAATHQNLCEKIQRNQFRADLYFRLNVVTVTPPALKDRMEDFDDLFYQFAKLYRVRFSHNAIQRLKNHTWPGNIRELKNLVARASALFSKESVDEIKVENLIDKTMIENTNDNFTNESAEENSPTLPVIKEIERQMIIKRLAANRGNQRRTALDLGMPKSTLHDRLKDYNIEVESFKA
ncbi:MAG: sigma 54-interacting transcriptional regulator [Bdellovibrionota bacterium]